MKPLKCFVCFLLILGGHLVAKAQKAVVSGHVSTTDGKPASQVVVRIEGKNWGDISDLNGNYHIDIPEAGTYVLHLSALGIEDQAKKLTINRGERLKTDFVINLSYTELADVIVLANQSQLGNKVSYGVQKMPLKNLENPQVYSSVGSDLMLQQGVTNFDDALRNVPGISRTWASTGRAGDGASYFALRGFEAQPSL